MLDKIKAILEKLNIDTFLIKEMEVDSAELFFVKKQLDMCRSKKIGSVTVTVCTDTEEDGKKFRGSSQALLSPDMTGEEMEKALQEALSRAGNALNPWYELYAGPQEEKYTAHLSEEDLMGEALKFAAALYEADCVEKAFVNSAEIFMELEKVHLVASSGTDVRYDSLNVQGEFVTQCRSPRDVEQHYQFEYNSADGAAAAGLVTEGLKTVADRARAEKAPAAGNYDIVLSGKHVAKLLDLYAFRANAAYVYAGYSNYKPGFKVQGEDVKGEKLNIRLLPRAPYSDEGIPMEERDLVKEGELCVLPSNARYAYYLGIEPTGYYERLGLENGTVPFEEMKKGCLYPVSFSDFQVDPMTGHFAGEIRLAYYYGEEGVQILTGGSVNGSLLERQNDLVFSKERYFDADYEGPLAVLIKNVAVAG